MIANVLGTMVPLVLIPALTVAQTAASKSDSSSVHQPDSAVWTAAEALVAEIPEIELRKLVVETLDRNPALEKLKAETRVSASYAEQARGLPDPKLDVTAYVSPPQTRVGPQRFSAELAQEIPWSGTRNLRGASEETKVTSRMARAEAAEISLVTDVRKTFFEWDLLEREVAIHSEHLMHLVQHEEIARMRYSTGVGLGQGVLKLQAEITSVQVRLVEIRNLRATKIAHLNQLRDRPPATALPVVALVHGAEPRLDLDELFDRALKLRPELRVAGAEAERAELLLELADKERKPNFVVGLTYAWVGDRDDEPGRLNPPPDNGQDIFGIRGGITIPLWGKKLTGMADEAKSLRVSADESRRVLEAEILSEIGVLVEKVPLLSQQIRLLEDLLLVQATEALESAKAAYISGTLNALDLLDGEHMLFNARIAVARSSVQLAIALAELEGAVGGPISRPAGKSGGVS